MKKTGITEMVHKFVRLFSLHNWFFSTNLATYLKYKTHRALVLIKKLQTDIKVLKHIHVN